MDSLKSSKKVIWNLPAQRFIGNFPMKSRHLVRSGTERSLNETIAVQPFSPFLLYSGKSLTRSDRILGSRCQVSKFPGYGILHSNCKNTAASTLCEFLLIKNCGTKQTIPCTRSVQDFHLGSMNNCIDMRNAHLQNQVKIPSMKYRERGMKSA